MMKGLLIKDFKLLKMQKNFFLILVLVSLGMVVFSDDLTFIIGFLTFVISLFTISTISYDEFDNGNPFLFSLPITRKDYAVEKYTLGLILTISALAGSTCIALIANNFRHLMLTKDIIIVALTFLPIALLAQAMMIPFNLKFGSEKGRIAMIGAFGLIGLLAIITFKILESIGFDKVQAIINITSLNPWILIGSSIIITGILFYISQRISIKIVEKKEF